MLNEATIQRLNARHRRVMVWGISVGLLAGSVYMVLLCFFCEPIIFFARHNLGNTAADVGRFALILVFFPLFLAPITVAGYFVKRFAIFCPECGNEITKHSRRVLFTRCCPGCGHHIVDGGRVREERRYTRYVEAQQRRFAKWLFWCFPALAALVLAIHVWDSTALEQSPNTLFLPALLGTVTAGWTWLRTRDQRYCPQTVASFALLIIGSYLWWRML